MTVPAGRAMGALPAAIPGQTATMAFAAEYRRLLRAAADALGEPQALAAARAWRPLLTALERIDRAPGAAAGRWLVHLRADAARRLGIRDDRPPSAEPLRRLAADVLAVVDRACAAARTAKARGR